MSPFATGASREQLEGANFATFLVFALNGCAFSSWASRIPATRDLLGVGPGELGILLFLGAAGSLIGLPLAGRVVSRFGSAATVFWGTVVGAIGFVAASLLATVTHSLLLTGAGLFVATFGIGMWDVSMNMEGAAVEHQLGRTIMPRYHAAFSGGTVLAALVGAGLAFAGVPPLVHLTGAAVLIFLGVSYGVRKFLPHGVEAAAEAAQSEPATEPTGGSPSEGANVVPAETNSGRSAWTEPRTLLVGLVTLVAAFTEGTANDWVAVAFRDGHDLPEWAGILGFATFLSFMTAGRFAGTGLVDRYGRVTVLRVTFGLACIGSLLMVFAPVALSYVGAAIWGFGASMGFPLGMSAAADEPSRAPARMSVVSTIAYGAFLAGPPLLGLLGDHVGVLRSLSVVTVMIVLVYAAIPAMAPPKREPAA